MSGLEALEALVKGAARRIKRSTDADDMYISIGDDGLFSLSRGYDEYIEHEFSFDLRWGSAVCVIEHQFNELLNDDWEVEWNDGSQGIKESTQRA